MTLVALHGLLTPTDHSLFSKTSLVVSVRHWWSLSCTQKQVLSCSSLLTAAKWCPQVFQGSTAGALVRTLLLWSSLGHCGAPSFTLLLGLAQKWKVCSHVYSAVNFDTQFPRITSYGPDFNMEDGLTKTAPSVSADTFFLYLGQPSSHRSSGDWSQTGSRALSLFFVPLLMSF